MNSTPPDASIVSLAGVAAEEADDTSDDGIFTPPLTRGIIADAAAIKATPLVNEGRVESGFIDSSDNRISQSPPGPEEGDTPVGSSRWPNSPKTPPRSVATPNKRKRTSSLKRKYVHTDVYVPVDKGCVDLYVASEGRSASASGGTVDAVPSENEDPLVTTIMGRPAKKALFMGHRYRRSAKMYGGGLRNTDVDEDSSDDSPINHVLSQGALPLQEEHKPQLGRRKLLEVAGEASGDEAKKKMKKD